MMHVDEVGSPSRHPYNASANENVDIQMNSASASISTKALGKRKAAPEKSPDDNEKMDDDEVVEAPQLTTAPITPCAPEEDDEDLAFMGRKGALALSDFVRGPASNPATH